MIGENIQSLRKQRGLTQEALAEKLGVTRQTVAKWESGESAPDLALAGALSREMDVSLDELVNAPIPGMAGDSPRGKHIFGLVAVGDKGQIVIPAAARSIFHIHPGDQLMVLGDENQGLALMDARFLVRAAEAIKHDKAK
ncbi:MAG: helix-turn-helix domain-containing protein [Clostridiales bacterium]|nr:helix-turn-helix domain-containing protein [Clostridiales bacterium]